MAKKKSMYEVGDIVETQTTNGLVKGVVEKKLYAELNPPVWIYTINGKLADGTPYMANSVREEDIISSINKGFEPMKHSVAMKNVTKFKEQELDPIFKAHIEECKKMGLGTKDCNKLWEEKYKPMYEEKKAHFDKILKESWLAEGYKTTGTTEKHNMSISAKGFKFPNSNLYFHGTKHNVNGNKVLQFSFSGGRKFSIYPSAFGYYNTIYFSKGDDFNEFAKDHFGSVENFEKQIVSYIVNRGTEMQKNELYYDESKINFACGGKNFSMREETNFKVYKKDGVSVFTLGMASKDTYENLKKTAEQWNEEFRKNVKFSIEFKKEGVCSRGAFGKIIIKTTNDQFFYSLLMYYGKTYFSLIDDTKDVLRAGGKMAGNVVKDTLYNGGILMF